MEPVNEHLESLRTRDPATLTRTERNLLTRASLREGGRGEYSISLAAREKARLALKGRKSRRLLRDEARAAALAVLYDDASTAKDTLVAAAYAGRVSGDVVDHQPTPVNVAVVVRGFPSLRASIEETDTPLLHAGDALPALPASTQSMDDATLADMFERVKAEIERRATSK